MNKAIVGPAVLSELLSKMIPARMPVMITGRPGIGKSEIVAQACEAAESNLIISHPVVSDPTDYKGLPFMGSDGVARFAPFSDLKALIEADKPTVFFLDDLGQAPASVQAAAMQLILARQINGHKVSDKVTFVAATNRRKDKAGVAGILEPVKSRFSIFELEPSLQDWVDWALEREWMPLQLIGACRWKPDWITKWEPIKGGEIENNPCPRNIVEVGKIMNLGLNPLHEFAAFASRIGSAAATELKAFMDLYSQLPSLNTIVNSPKTAVVPKRAASKFALMGALVEKADDKAFEPILKYLERVDADYGVLFMRDIVRRKPKLISTAAYIKWSVKNQHIIL